MDVKAKCPNMEVATEVATKLYNAGYRIGETFIKAAVGEVEFYESQANNIVETTDDDDLCVMPYIYINHAAKVYEFHISCADESIEEILENFYDAEEETVHWATLLGNEYLFEKEIKQ